VDAEQSERTGLAVYSAGGGLHSLGGLGSVIYRMKGGFGLEGFARFDRLVGDAADSPVVRSSAGSRNQFELGLGLTYSFGL
jgi:outer membrane protein